MTLFRSEVTFSQFSNVTNRDFCCVREERPVDGQHTCCMVEEAQNHGALVPGDEILYIYGSGLYPDE